MTIPGLDELDLLHRHICQAIGDPKRIQMLYALYETPQAVSSLAERLDLPQPTVSRHLGILRERSLVNTDRQGTTIVYSIADPTIIHVLNTMRQLLRNLLERQTNALE